MLRPSISLILIAFLAFALRAHAADLPAPAAWVRFQSFSYSGTDPAAAQVGKDQFLNPVLAGFYPDPSICRVRDEYFLVTSSFWYFPGIPIFRSKDLVNWTQIGFALDRPSQFASIKGGDVSRGVYAPTIRYQNGHFYIIATMVEGQGTFFLSATDPAGSWSGPFWLNSVDGIDPSLFFDDDRSAYVLHCAPPLPGAQQYEGHRTIRMRQIDLQTALFTGDEKVLVNGGTDIAKKPQWIEGPHLFRYGKNFWLIAAEGGTGTDHSVVAFRSDALWGPYTPIAENPILSQRQLGNRADPITCTGHADFVETQSGDWWAVFLGCRPYERAWFNTGRETFLLPVTWEKDQPAILAADQAVPRVLARPKLPPQPDPATPLHGALSWTDTFDADKLNFRWQQLRAPSQTWLAVDNHALVIAPRAVPLTAFENPSLIACRQQHATFAATAQIALSPATLVSDAGIVAFQNETHYFFLGIRINAKTPELFLEQMNTPAARRTNTKPQILATTPLPAGDKVELKIQSTGRLYSFSYRTGGGDFKPLKENVDGSILSTDLAGGFQGVMLGMYARTPAP